MLRFYDCFLVLYLTKEMQCIRGKKKSKGYNLDRCPCFEALVVYLRAHPSISEEKRRRRLRGRLLEEPARSLILARLQAGDGRVSSRVAATAAASSAERLGDAAAGVGEAEAAETRGRVQAASAARLGSFQAVLDSSQLHLESTAGGRNRR